MKDLGDHTLPLGFPPGRFHPTADRAPEVVASWYNVLFPVPCMLLEVRGRGWPAWDIGTRPAGDVVTMVLAEVSPTSKVDTSSSPF